MEEGEGGGRNKEGATELTERGWEGWRFGERARVGDRVVDQGLLSCMETMLLHNRRKMEQRHKRTAHVDVERTATAMW